MVVWYVKVRKESWEALLKFLKACQTKILPRHTPPINKDENLGLTERGVTSNLRDGCLVAGIILVLWFVYFQYLNRTCYVFGSIGQ